MSQEGIDKEAETTEDVSLDDMATDLGEMSDETEGTPSTEQPEVESTDKAADEPVYEVNGEQVTLEQLKSGFMMQADYTRGKQELAEARKAVEREANDKWLDDYFDANTKAEPQKVQEKVSDTDGITLSDEDIAMLDPIQRKTFELAQANSKQLEAYKEEKLQRQRAETNSYIVNTFEGFAKKLEDGGMDAEEAGNMAADISAKTRALAKEGKVSYCPETLDMVYKMSIDVDKIAKDSAKTATSEYLKEKEKDAEAGLAGASSLGAALPNIDPVELDFEDPEKLLNLMANDLGDNDGF